LGPERKWLDFVLVSFFVNPKQKNGGHKKKKNAVQRGRRNAAHSSSHCSPQLTAAAATPHVVPEMATTVSQWI
jgi:hypothetical protein